MDVKGEEMPYPILVGRRSGITQKYKIRRLPHLVILDRESFIETAVTFLKTEEMKEIIDRLLEK